MRLARGIRRRNKPKTIPHSPAAHGRASGEATSRRSGRLCVPSVFHPHPANPVILSRKQRPPRNVAPHAERTAKGEAPPAGLLSSGGDDKFWSHPLERNLFSYGVHSATIVPMRTALCAGRPFPVPLHLSKGVSPHLPRFQHSLSASQSFHRNLRIFLNDDTCKRSAHLRASFPRSVQGLLRAPVKDAEERHASFWRSVRNRKIPALSPESLLKQASTASDSKQNTKQERPDMFCPSCGASVPDNARFAAPAARASSPPLPLQPRRRLRPLHPSRRLRHPHRPSCLLSRPSRGRWHPRMSAFPPPCPGPRRIWARLLFRCPLFTTGFWRPCRG